MEMKINRLPYIGNGAYCYANSTSMLLASINEDISPSELEVLSGVGLGAFLYKDKDTNFLFFGWDWPDNGIDNTLKILGFRSSRKNTLKTEQPPINKLKKDLEKSVAVVGPLDMGYLVYNPRCFNLSGADHFVVVYRMTEEEVYLHDPAGFPCVQLPMKKFELAWRAEKVSYGKDNFSYWIAPKRLRSPTEEEVYQGAIRLFRLLYQHCDERAKGEGWIIGKRAILSMAERVEERKITQSEIEHLTYFALQLGAKRALDYASFFDFYDLDLAALKYQQAELFGRSHTFLVAKNFQSFAKELRKLAEVEDEFRIKLLEKGIK